MKKAKTAVVLGAFIILGMGAKVEADTVPQSGVNRIHFINTKGSPGTDAILLESNGHYALTWGKTMIFQMAVIHYTH